jgi:hypothetical protein
MREARDVMGDLAASGLTADQLVLMMELVASVTAEARPMIDEGAKRRRERDRERKRNVRGIPQNSADSVESAENPSPSFLPLSPTPPNPNQSTPNPPPYSPPALKPTKPTKAELDAIWEITPALGRQRSSRSDLERSLGAAMRRGHEPKAVLAGIRAAYASESYSGDMAKGVHRLIEADRWASFTEDPKAGPDWPAAVELWRASGRWPKSLGPPPDHPETQVPETLRAA